MHKNKSIIGIFIDQSERWPLWLPVLFGIGIGLYFALAFEPEFSSTLRILSTCMALTFFVRKTPALRVSLMAVLTILAGFFVAQSRTLMVEEPILEKKIGPTNVSGLITLIEDRPSGIRITLEKLRIGRLEIHKTPTKIRLNVKKVQKAFLPGDWVKTTAVLMPPMAPVAPGAFDFQRYAYFKGLGAVGFSYGEPEIIAREKKVFATFKLKLAQIRREVSKETREIIAHESGAVVAALLTGDKGGISEETLEEIRGAGLAHLLAISGLHVGLIAMFVFFSVRSLFALFPNLALTQPIKKWAAVWAIFCAFGYTLLVGGTVPTQRAFIMVSVVFLAIMVDRQGISMRTLAIAAFAVLFLQPEAILSPSFQMSFAAVTALVAAYERVGNRFFQVQSETVHPNLIRSGNYLVGVALTTVIATLATTPFALHHFNTMAVYGVFANLIAVPLMAFWVMPLIVLAWLLMPFGLMGLLEPLLDFGVNAILDTAHFFSSLEGAVLHLKAPDPLFIILVSLGGLWLCLWKKHQVLVSLSVIFFGCLIYQQTNQPNLLVDEAGELKGIFEKGQVPALSSLRKSRMASSSWLGRVGFNGSPKKWPSQGVLENGVRCDHQACLWRTENTLVSFIDHPSAASEDCQRADLVVSTHPLRGRCQGPALVIDRFDLWREGAHAFWIKNGKVTLETVAQRQGDRPWSVYAKRVKQAGTY